MSGINTAVTFDTLQSIAGASVTGSYQLFATFAAPGRVFFLQNNTGAALDISDDGTRQVHYMPIGASLLINVAANRQDLGLYGGTWYVAKGAKLYVKTSSLTAPLTLTSLSG